MSFSSFVSALPVVGPVSALPVAAPVCPLASGAGVPASVVVAGRVVASSRFVPVASGVVSACSAADPRGVVCVVGGRSFRCLWSALGGAGSPAAVSLVAALRAARASGVAVDLWCAPGRGGLPCPGYFCAVSGRALEALLSSVLDAPVAPVPVAPASSVGALLRAKLDALEEIRVGRVSAPGYYTDRVVGVYHDGEEYCLLGVGIPGEEMWTQERADSYFGG